MEFEEGKPLVLLGDVRVVRKHIHQLSISMQNGGRKILLVDTLNAINPHDKIYMHRFDLLRNIYCVRAENPYDLSARLGTASSFIQKQQIRVLLINSINHVFADAHKHEIEPLFNIIWDKIKNLGERYDLQIVLGLSSNLEEDRIPELLLGRNLKIVTV